MKSRSYSQIWKEAPFFRLLIPLIAGILLQYYFPVNRSFNGLVLLLCLFLLILSLVIPPRKLFGWEWMMGLAIHLAFLSLGRLLIICHQDISISQSFENSIPPDCLLIARLEKDPVRKARSFKSIATIQYVYTHQSCLREKERMLIYFQAEVLPEKIRSGAVIIFKKLPLPIQNMPGFDYKKYCSLRHIHSQAFLSPADYAVLDEEPGNFLQSNLISWRKKLLGIIKQYVPGKEENSLLEALMLGYTDDLDRELLQSYSNTGVVHIIAISGLHLALIYQILQLLLQKISGKKTGRWLKLIILLGSLWTFSFLSGASPSVIRSAVMFSFLLLARNLSRESIMYNTLASSAFLLLCFDPLWLWDIGFQLSYSAVLSLIIFMKPINGLLLLQNKLLAGLWNSTSVSLAAQILTTPISMYYFHRFPNYFLFANLVAVPLSSAILLGGILLCAFSFSGIIATGIGWVISKLIGLMNGFVQYISHLPLAVTGGISLNIPQVVTLYFLTWCIYCFFVSGEKKWFMAALISICFFLAFRVLPRFFTL